ncbi:ATP-grasp domain-containing protein [Terasakiella pusilla]|uniref:carboxylate--amine ligase n=1 Tax=Terasakiella pusilla TaxID=64973 RepID=UPI003AA7BF41
MVDKKQNGRVIVTYGRSLIALMIAQSLGSRGIDVIGCDDVALTVLSFSKCVSKTCLYTSWEEDEEQYIEDLLAIAKENKPEDGQPYLLIPAFRDAKILAKYKDRFEGIITVACPDLDAIEQVDHKDAFARTTQKFDVESPKTWLPANQDELAADSEEMDFPVFIKPPNEVGGRGISKIDDKDALIDAFTDLQDRFPDQQILIQSLAKGVDYCFCGLFDQGKLVASMVYHNLRKFPAETGPGVVRETVDSEAFDQIAEKLMKPLKWHGVAGIDFMWDEKGTPQMIEVNARFWAGLDHSVKSNVDFPYLLYRLFVDGQVDWTSEALIGKKTSLPGLSTLARIESLFDDKFHFERLQDDWPKIKQSLQDMDLDRAQSLFADALSDSLSFGEAVEAVRDMLREAEEAEKINYADDDPFIGLGVLFVLGSLIRHGKLPPEIKR